MGTGELQGSPPETGRHDARAQRAAYERRENRYRDPAEEAPASLRDWKRHNGLRKYESSVSPRLAQGYRAPLLPLPEARTGGGIAARGCGEAPETAFHVVVQFCRLEDRRILLCSLLAPRALRTRRDFENLLEGKRTARILARWLTCSGRLPEFQLARQIEGASSG